MLSTLIHYLIISKLDIRYSYNIKNYILDIYTLNCLHITLVEGVGINTITVTMNPDSES